jgi:hypothetical protein
LIRPLDQTEIVTGTPQPKIIFETNLSFVSPIFWAQIHDPSLPSWTFGHFFIIFRVLGSYVSFMYFLFLGFVFKQTSCLLAEVSF